MKANETPREELLQRDVMILLTEVRELRKEKEELQRIIRKIKALVQI